MSERKNWFRVPDSVAFDTLTNDELATLIRLQAYMNTRWARDGKRPSERGKCVLDSRTMMMLTGKGRADVARTLVEHLADITSMSARRRGDVVEIDWPKYAKFQEMALPKIAPPTPISDTITITKEEKISEAPSAPPAKRAPRARVKSPCPDSLEPEEAAKIAEWAVARGLKRPDLFEEWEAMRDHWRGKHELRADWAATFRTWLRNAQRFAARDQQRSLLPSPAQAKAERTKDAARRAYELIQERKLELVGGNAS